jgi:hypothetical protein
MEFLDKMVVVPSFILIGATSSLLNKYISVLSGFTFKPDCLGHLVISASEYFFLGGRNDLLSYTPVRLLLVFEF